MSKWESNLIILGDIKENSTAKFSYLLVEPVEIVNIKPSCGGCTKVQLVENFLNVTYTSGKIPKHLANKQPFQHVTLMINVTYGDGTKEQLKFTAKIKKDVR